MLIKQLLMSSGYWVLNKKIVQKLGIETAFLLSNFAEAETMMKDNNGWFYQTYKTVEDMTGLNRYKQDKAIDKLEELNILKKDVRGMPAKRYFKINYDVLSKIVFKSSTSKIVENQQTSMRTVDKQDCKSSTNKNVNNSQTSMQNINKQDCKSSTTNKEHINKESNKESNNKDQKNIELFDYWQNKPHLHEHRSIGKQVKKQLDNLPLKEVENVKLAIDRYEKALVDDNYYYNNVWTLDKFIKQSNGYTEWLDDGARWVDYNSRNKINEKPIANRCGVKQADVL